MNYKHTQELDRADRTGIVHQVQASGGVVELGLDSSEPGKDIVEFIFLIFIK